MEELLHTCRLEDLKAFRRSLPSAAATQSTRKGDLIAEFLSKFDDAAMERVCSEVLASRRVPELRLFLARLRNCGFQVAKGPQPRREDLTSAIIGAKFGPGSHAPGRSAAPGESKGLSSSGPDEERSKGACFSSSVSRPRQPLSSMMPSPQAPMPMALVALDSTAAPAKLQRKLRKRWAKKCAKFIRKQDRKRKLKRVEEETRKALQEHEETKVKDLRVIVANAVGLAVTDFKFWVRFDSSLAKLTRPPPAPKRRQRPRFSIAE